MAGENHVPGMRLFIILSLFPAVAGIYHFLAMFIAFNSTPAWKHAIFVCINLFCVYGIVKRPKYFVYLFFVLMVHQFATHGARAINRWNGRGAIDWMGLSVLIVLPVIFAFLIKDMRGNKNNLSEKSGTGD